MEELSKELIKGCRRILKIKICISLEVRRSEKR